MRSLRSWTTRSEYDLLVQTPEKQCLKCGGATASAYLAPSLGETVLKPVDDGWIQRRYSRIAADTCLNCGYTQLFAINPSKLTPRKSD